MQAFVSVARLIDIINGGIGRTVCWLAVSMVIVQFFVVVLRYGFGLGFIWMQESIIYMHTYMFMLGAAFTYYIDGHVRVDILYGSMSDKGKAWVNLLGSALFMIPMSIALFYYAFPIVIKSWQILESSTDNSGIPAVFILKSALLIFPVMMVLQAISAIIHSLATLNNIQMVEASAEEHQDMIAG